MKASDAGAVVRRFAAGWLGVCACAVLACGGPQEADPGADAGQGDAPRATRPDAETEAARRQAGPPVRGDWLVLHMLSDPENLNPLTSSDAGASSVLRFVFQSLVRIDPETHALEPLLARALPEVSEDHLTYTYELRDDVTFSDGTKLTAEDVLFTLKAIRHPEVAAPHLRNYYDSVRDAVAEGPQSVRIELHEPYFRNDWTLGGIDVLPRHHYDPDDLLGDIGVAALNDWESLSEAERERATRFADAFNEDYLRRPLGSGAYALEDPERDFVTGERIVLRHRDDYWAPGDTDLGDGWVERILFRIINDTEAAFVALKAGDLDLLGLTPIQAVRQTGGNFRERFGLNRDVRGSYVYIGWNQQRDIFRDVRVRQALSHLVDKQNLVDKVMLGLARPIESPIFFDRPEYNDDLEPWGFDPEKAAALLAEAGWTDGDGDGVLDKQTGGERVPLRFEIISNAGNDQRKKIGLAVIDQLKRHGIDASFRSVDWSIMLEKVSQFDYDAVVLGWSNPGGGAIPPDGYQIWHSSQAVENGSNHVYFRNQEVDRILEAYRVTFDAEERAQLYHRFQEILYEQQPYTFLFAPTGVSAWDLRFRGVEWYPGLAPSLNEWWVPKALQKY